MKIYHAAASPFVRKCLVAAAELGLRDRIELVTAAAHPVNRDQSVVAHNPLGKIPTLITDDGSVALRQPRDLRIPERAGRRPSHPARRASRAWAC